MSRSSRGGRRAALPASEWSPAERLLPDGTSVQFVEEATGQSKVFDFSSLPVSAGIQRWLAASLARQVTARSSVTRIRTARGLAGIARKFAVALSEHPVPVAHPRDITADHMLAFRRRHEHLKSLGGYVDSLRRLLKGDEELSEAARAALRSIRVRKIREEPKELEYSDAQWQMILTAVRRDVRIARDRIGHGRQLLACFRAGELTAGSDKENLGRMLDVFDRTGDVPRYGDGTQTAAVVRSGAITCISSLLCLSLNELTAFALLMVALTGQNFGTVVALPAVHFRPDGGLSEDGPALVEAVKARRGPEREHMVVPLEDVLTGTDGEHRLFRSPLRVYQLLLELSEISRRHGGTAGAFAGYVPRPGRYGGGSWDQSIESHHVLRWARSHGFPNAESAAESDRPAVSVRRLRRTVIERRRRPVAQSSRTMREIYLMPSQAVQEESHQIVTAALQGEVNKARKQQNVPVFTPAFVELARNDLASAAEAAGLDPQGLKGLLSGDQDTVLASCVDHTSGPHTPAGQPCTASFLTCLDCENARALPHQLPVQLAAIDEILAARPHLDPQLWSMRFEPRLRQLEDIAGIFGPTELERARTAITDGQRQLVRDLLEGRWDLR